MKYIAKSLLIAGAMIGVSSATAMGLGDFDCMTPYLGAEYEWSTTSGRNSNPSIRGLSHGHLHGKSRSGANFFLGGRWCNFATEIGYDFTSSTKRHTLVNARNAAILNDFVDSNLVAGDRLHGKTRLSGWHIDFNGYLPVCECWELVGSVGFGWTKAHVSSHSVYAGSRVAAITSNRFSHHAHSSYKGNVRLGAGAQYMMTECVGLRMMARWKNTEKVTVNTRHRGNNSLACRSATLRPFKDTISLSAGLFVKF